MSHLVEDNNLEETVSLHGTEIVNIESHSPRRADCLAQLRHVAQKCLISLQGRFRRDVRAAMDLAGSMIVGFAFLKQLSYAYRKLLPLMKSLFPWSSQLWYSKLQAPFPALHLTFDTRSRRDIHGEISTRVAYMYRDFLPNNHPIH